MAAHPPLPLHHHHTTPTTTTAIPTLPLRASHHERRATAATPPPAFLLDSMLGRLCKWLRVLGVDAQFQPYETPQPTLALSAVGACVNMSE